MAGIWPRCRILSYSTKKTKSVALVEISLSLSHVRQFMLCLASAESPLLQRPRLQRRSDSPVPPPRYDTFYPIRSNYMPSGSSPIHRIPPELLCHIFLQCHLPDRWYVPSRLNPPLALGSVCQFWRSAALSLPGLWSSIFVRVKGDQLSPCETCIRLWLKRSRTSPLNFSISQTDLPPHPNSFMTLLDILADHIHLCRSLSLTLEEFPPNLAPYVTRRKPCLLEEIFLQVYNVSTLADGLSTFSLPSSPALRRLKWVNPPPRLTDVSIPWNQLTDIVLTTPCLVDDFIKVLQMSPLVVHCSIRVRGRLNRIVQPFTLPHLQTFFIYALIGLDEIFSILKLPSLQQIYIDQSVESPWAQRQFIALLSRSQCSLRTLQLRRTLISQIELIESLRFVSSSLIRFEISSLKAVLTDRVIGQLTDSPNTSEDVGCLCPHLEVFQIGIYRRQNVTASCISTTDGVLAEMVLSRSGSLSVGSSAADGTTANIGLKSLECYFGTPESRHNKDISSLRNIKGSGVEIRLGAEFWDWTQDWTGYWSDVRSNEQTECS
jgi:F-box-like